MPAGAKRREPRRGWRARAAPPVLEEYRGPSQERGSYRSSAAAFGAFSYACAATWTASHGAIGGHSSGETEQASLDVP